MTVASRETARCSGPRRPPSDSLQVAGDRNGRAWIGVAEHLDELAGRGLNKGDLGIERVYVVVRVDVENGMS
jgi:hypothetical protein